MTDVEGRLFSLSRGKVYHKATNFTTTTMDNTATIVAQPPSGKKLFIESLYISSSGLDANGAINLAVFDGAADTTPATPYLFKDIQNHVTLRPFFMNFEGCPVPLEKDQLIRATVGHASTTGFIVITGYTVEG